MGNECQRFLKHLADKIVQKDTEPYHVVITWLRTQISFELLRSVHDRYISSLEIIIIIIIIMVAVKLSVCTVL